MKILIAMLAALTVGVHGHTTATETMKMEAPDTANEAAVLALKNAYDNHPHYYEYGGVIVQMKNGKFNASMPTSDHHADNMEIDEDPEAYDEQDPIVADYHTHPCIEGYIPGVFSPADLRSMREERHGGYILDECTGDVHYWAPGDGYDPPPAEVVEKLGPTFAGLFARRNQIATGKVVGRIPVDGKKIVL